MLITFFILTTASRPLTIYRSCPWKDFEIILTVMKFHLSLQNNYVDKTNKPTFLINLKTKVNICTSCTIIRLKIIFIKMQHWIQSSVTEIFYFQNGSLGDSSTNKDIQFACTQEQLQVHIVTRVATRQGKIKFSPGQGILKNVGEFTPFDTCQGKIKFSPGQGILKNVGEFWAIWHVSGNFVVTI